MRHRRGSNVTSGCGGAGCRYDWSGLGRCWHTRQDGSSRNWQNGWYGDAMAREEEGSKYLLE